MVVQKKMHRQIQQDWSMCESLSNSQKIKEIAETWDAGILEWKKINV